MNRGKSGDRYMTQSAKTASNLNRNQNFESYSHWETNSEEPSPSKGELHLVKRDISLLREGIINAESAKARAELELSKARKKVKDLASGIEESISRVSKIGDRENQKLGKDGLVLSQGETEDDQDAEVIRELKIIKQELSKLKFDMAFVLEEKEKAENETEASRSKFQSCSRLLEEMRKKIDELNEEHVLVALARIEARKEYAAIEAQRKEKAKSYLTSLDGIRKNINNLSGEAAYVNEIRQKLAVTSADVNNLKHKLSTIKAMDIQRQDSSKHPEDCVTQGEQLESASSLRVVSEELEGAKHELAATNDERFQLMSSIDIIRKEIKQLKEETTRLRETDEKAELTIQSVNSKLLRAKAKLEALSAAEEKANSISSSLDGTLKHLRIEAEEAKKERESDINETAKIKAEVLRTKSWIELNELKLEASIQELNVVNSSEAMALKKLKPLVEISMKARASACQYNSTITISSFEHEYLKGCAVRAKEVADKKIAAAHAWIEALRASEKEISMKTKILQRETKELRVVAEEAWDQERKCNKSLDPERVQFEDASSRKSLSRNGLSTPARRAKFRKSGSPARFHMSRSSSITIDWKKKGVSNLGKLLGGKNIDGKGSITSEAELNSLIK